MTLLLQLRFNAVNYPCTPASKTPQNSPQSETPADAASAPQRDGCMGARSRTACNSAAPRSVNIAYPSPSRAMIRPFGSCPRTRSCPTPIIHHSLMTIMSFLLSVTVPVFAACITRCALGRAPVPYLLKPCVCEVRLNMFA